MSALRYRVAFALVATTLMSSVVGVGAATATPTGTWFQYSSAPGDSIGGGVSGTYTTPAAPMNGAIRAGAAAFQVSQAGQTWNFWFSPGPGGSLSPGQYTGANSVLPNRPLLEVDNLTHSCTAYYGSFTINTIGFDQNGQLHEFDAAFVQRCGSSSAPALSGRITFHAPKLGAVMADAITPTSVGGEPATFAARVNEGGSTPSGTVTFRDGAHVLGTDPVIAPGVALYTTSTLAAGAHNISATYSGDAHHPAATSLAIVQTVMGSTPSFWFESSTGNEIGNGARGSYTPATAMFTVGGTLSEATVTVREMWDSWTITLAPMTGHVLAPGYYSGASTNSDAKHPSLDISDDGYACNDVGGVFRIFSIATDSAGHVTELSADISAGCQSLAAPISGAIAMAG